MSAITTSAPAAAKTATIKPAEKRLRKGRTLESAVGMLMAAPASLLLLIFFFVPVVLSFALAFTNARLISPRPPRIVGFDNFVTLFSDSLFWTSLRNTLYFAVVVVPVQAGLALALALLVNAKFRGRNFFRTIYFLPVVTSIVVVSLLWRFIYQPDGLLNHLI
jgi:multiple sugar transport system permease protein